MSDKNCCYLVHYDYSGDELGDTLVAICQTQAGAEAFVESRPKKWQNWYTIVEWEYTDEAF